MKTCRHLALAAVLSLGAADVNAQTVYGSCPETSQFYQVSYEIGHRTSDLVCFQEALKREMEGNAPYECPLTAQYYQDAWISSHRSGDLVCFQMALQRELQ